MANYRLLLEYLGTEFHGWQVQPGLRTIQGELQRVIEVITRESVEVIGSGRTDAGVHALGQVANVHIHGPIETQRLSLSINSLLSPELSCLEVVPVDEDFHARFSASGKCYQYQILNRSAPSVFHHERAWHVRAKLNLELLDQHARTLVGEHDFSSFRGPGCGAPHALKHIQRIEILEREDLILIEIEGRGFLKQMVRNIVGTLIELNLGKLDLQNMQEVLESRSRVAAGMTAPACGLYLKQVFY